jgi:hypothetical protein
VDILLAVETLRRHNSSPVRFCAIAGPSSTGNCRAASNVANMLMLQGSLR